tara:strand:- start:425 stop:880 length:456 start_codon:yes stop_codon:yes gene_type:complete
LEKENNKTTLIHRDLFKKEEESKEVFVYSCVNENIINFLLKVKDKKQITIIDKTFCDKNKNKEWHVNNHVNKTGENPLRGRQSLSVEPFFDITRLYSFLPKGVTTTSWGHNYKTMKNKNQHPSTYMSNLAILCKAVGFKEITGILINNQEG